MHCLIIGKVWPEPVSTAAGRRTLDILRSLQGAGWKLSFASGAQKGPHSLDLEAMGVSTHSIRVNDSGFDNWLEQLAPDVVIFDRFMIEEQFGWRVEKVCPRALRVLDTSDLHCLRDARKEQLKTGGSLNLFNEIALREIAAIHRSDLTLMISEYEVQILKEHFSIAASQIAYLPFMLDLRARSFPEFSARQHFIMIGSFQHAPNLDAARWCKQLIWPMIRQSLPEAELHLYGSYGDKYAGELNDPKNGFHFNGRADDALDTMQQYRINLAPLRFGAGLKGKLFDAFDTGTPSVTTPIGVEGVVEDASEWGCQVSDDPEQLAKVAIQLYEDEARWSQLQAHGQRIADTRFDEAIWLKRFPQMVSGALDRLDVNRNANFVGQMLRHHHHRSTEFMSRWIEAKNK
ncbi:MAG: glycosyltransferase [Opitutaceae bacterium]